MSAPVSRRRVHEARRRQARNDLLAVEMVRALVAAHGGEAS